MNNLFYLGVAIKSPLKLLSGRVATIAGYELINQSIADILATPVGTRLFNEGYGSRLNEIQFEPNDEVLDGMLRMLIEEAIRKWETRTKFSDLVLSRDPSEPGSVMCEIFHQPLASNEIKSFVYPFYFTLN